MKSINLNNLVFGITINKEKDEYYYGYGKIGHLENDLFIDVETGKKYNIFPTNDEKAIQILEFDLKYFIRKTKNNPIITHMKISDIKKSIRKKFVNLVFEDELEKIKNNPIITHMKISDIKKTTRKKIVNLEFEDELENIKNRVRK